MVDEEKYCARCGRRCTHGATMRNNKWYGPVCVTKIAIDQTKRGSFGEFDF